jgi:hypothetical protein
MWVVTIGVILARESITSYTLAMKTAISIPNGDFERFERVAARHGMNRSEFYRLAGSRLAEELEGEAELTALANSVIARVGQPSAGSPFLRESERTVREGTDW